jgi:HEAT repeat protein
MDRLEGLATTAILSQLASAPSGDSEERWALVRELHRRGDSETFRSAVDWCHSDEASLRCLGADLLGQLGYADSHPFGEESAPILVKLLDDHESDVVADALIALGHLGRGDASIIAALAAHGDAGVRYAVAVCLGPRTEDVATRTLVSLTRDDDRDVRDWATFGLGDMSRADGADVRMALSERLVDLDEEIRGEAMVGLANRRVTEAIPAILRELRTTGALLAIRAAGILRDPCFVPELSRLAAAYPAEREIRNALDRCSSH